MGDVVLENLEYLKCPWTPQELACVGVSVADYITYCATLDRAKTEPGIVDWEAIRRTRDRLIILERGHATCPRCNPEGGHALG